MKPPEILTQNRPKYMKLHKILLKISTSYTNRGGGAVPPPAPPPPTPMHTEQAINSKFEKTKKEFLEVVSKNTT